jgi:PhnB protein
MTVNPVREGFHTITPYLIVQEAAQLIDFVKQAFAATELFRGTGSAGGIHAEVRIGDSMLMIGGGGAWSGEPMPATIYLYIDDVDSVYARAIQAGATSITEPGDRPYGDRLGGVKDRFGNVWYISTHNQDVPL